MTKPPPPSTPTGRRVLALYDVLTAVSPGPFATLSRAVALAQVHGPRAGLTLLDTLDTDARMAHTHQCLGRTKASETPLLCAS